jgi:AraC-like DNA-binding protein
VRYVEVPPPPALADHVRCLWLLEGRADEPAVERILPDGCPELVIHFGEPFARIDDAGACEVQRDAVLVGQLRRALLVRPSRRAGVAGVRFTPDGAASFLRMPLADMTGSSIDARDAWGRSAGDLVERLVEADGDDARFGLLVAQLLAWRHVGREDRVVRFAVARLHATRGGIRVADLARACNLSPRQLERRFRERVGLSPKRMARIGRFRSALAALRASRGRDQAAVAQAAGYADQPHFVREFSDFAGLSPSRWLAETHGLDDLFADDAFVQDAGARSVSS